MSILTVLFVAALAILTVAQELPLQFTATVAGYDNTVFRDNRTSAQLLVPSKDSGDAVQRFIAAFPAGNSGALMYFLSSNDSLSTFNDTQHPENPLRIEIINSSVTSIDNSGYDNLTGVNLQLGLNSNASLGVTILGDVRAMRDYTEGGGLMHEIFNYTLGEHSDHSFSLHRDWINGTHSMNVSLASADVNKVKFEVIPSENTTRPPIVNFIIGKDVTQGIVNMTVAFTEDSIGPGIDPDKLYLQPAENQSSTLQAALKDLNGTNKSPATQMSFLSYESKFLAGGWRFLTYFGRDNLIALRLTMSILQSDAIEAALSGVIERIYVNGTNTSPVDPVYEGEVCHEETIGDYASFINIGNNRTELGNTPFYAYPMIDTDFYLLPTLAHYFLDLNQGKGRSEKFFERNSSLSVTKGLRYSELLEKNIKFVLNASKPFAQNPSVDNLLHLKYSEPVGSWRDSNNGLGYGRIPFDVNVGLVPGCLRSIARLSEAGLIDSSYLDSANQYAEVWEEKAAQYFEVTHSIPEDWSRLQNYTNWANLTESLNYGEGAFNGTSFAIDGAGMNESNPHGWINIEGNNHTYYALSLFNDSSPVATLHSDIGAPMLYSNNLSESFMKAVADALLPFPKGLMTPIGMVVANPAMDTNASNFANFDRTQYQGTVVWGWQMGIMASGLIQQLSYCGVDLPQVDTYVRENRPTWCGNKNLVSALLAGLDRLWQGVEGAGRSNIYSEVWSYSFQDISSEKNIKRSSNGGFSIADLGKISPTGTEGDAIQLWSYGFLALEDPRTQISNSSGNPMPTGPADISGVDNIGTSVLAPFVAALGAFLIFNW